MGAEIEKWHAQVVCPQLTTVTEGMGGGGGGGGG